MAEYIDREAVMDAFAQRVKRSNNSDFASPPTWNSAVGIVERFPAADVVEVVRCKNCRMSMLCADERERYCTSTYTYKPSDYYCANGKVDEEADK